MFYTHSRVKADVCAMFVAVIALPDALMAQSSDVPKTDAATSEAAAGASGSGETAGQLAFNNSCRTCHSTDAGDNRLGPSLGGVVGRKAGTVSGFAYSQSMERAGITWDEATLDKFIADPNSVVPGNKMTPYTGIADADVRSKIISHLKAN